jgi:CRP-like cAMP-binding protein
VEPRRPLPRLSPDARAALAGYGAKAAWPAGFAIYQRGTPADGLFVVLSGRVVLRSRVKAGRGFVPGLAVAGETFGAEGLAPRATYATDARAEDASETLHVSGAALRTFLREQPLYGQALLGQVMAERTEMLEKLRELATLSVEERLIASMVRLAERAPAERAVGVGAANGGGNGARGAPLVLGPNQYRLLCELVGATRESVSLVFNRLAAAGLVERDGANYSVPDVGVLASRLGAVWQEADAAVPVAREPGVGGRAARL